MRRATLTAPVALGLAVVLLGAALAGMNPHTGWSVGVFALMAAGAVVLGAHPEAWASPVGLALAAPLSAVLTAASWLGAAWLAQRLGYRASWGPLPPLVLGGAGLALAIVEGRKRR